MKCDWDAFHRKYAMRTCMKYALHRKYSLGWMYDVLYVKSHNISDDRLILYLFINIRIPLEHFNCYFADKTKPSIINYSILSRCNRNNTECANSIIRFSIIPHNITFEKDFLHTDFILFVIWDHFLDDSVKYLITG